MAQMQTPATDSTHSANALPADEDDAIRKRLLSRIAVAGVIIVGLLGGLAVYDALNKPLPPAMPKMAAAPATPAAPAEPAAKPEEEKPVAEKPAEEKVVEEKPAEVAAEPERTAAPVATGPAVPEKLVEKPYEKSVKPAKPLTPPATAQTASIKPSAPVAPAVKPDAQREISRAIPEGTRQHVLTPRTAQAPHAPASRPLTQMAEGAKRFLVQAGVFSNHANAEELVNRLHEAGIPAQIESRVQVGPFASRAEADAARTKMKSMGIDDGMLVRR